MKNTRKIIFLGLMVAQSLVLYIIESFMPVPFIAPGAKLGLANIITVVSLYMLTEKQAMGILLVRIMMSSIFGGGFSAFLYSLTGGIFSFVFMALVKRNEKYFSIIGTSVAGALFHNIGQLLMASFIIKNLGIYIYFPILALVSIPTGIFVGIVSNSMVKKYKILFKSYIQQI